MTIIGQLNFEQKDFQNDIADINNILQAELLNLSNQGLFINHLGIISDPYYELLINGQNIQLSSQGILEIEDTNIKSLLVNNIAINLIINYTATDGIIR